MQKDGRVLLGFYEQNALGVQSTTTEIRGGKNQDLNQFC